MTTSLTIRMDKALKADAEEFFEDIGMNLTTAITCFFKKCLASNEIPFKFSRKENLHNRLLASLKEAEEIEKDSAAPTCTDPDKIEEFMLS